MTSRTDIERARYTETLREKHAHTDIDIYIPLEVYTYIYIERQRERERIQRETHAARGERGEG